MFELEVYESQRGEVPLCEFIDSCDNKTKAKVIRFLDLLEENGNKLREPYSKHLSDGIFELRIKLGSNTSRVLYFFYDGEKIVVTHGFNKKTRRTPRKEIDKAKKYRADWIERNNNEA